jgi:hypothetical protein
MGGLRARYRCVQGQFAVSRPLDNPVIPRGLGPLSICMDDRYAWAGLDGEGGLRMVLIPTMQVAEYWPAPQT